VASEVVGRKTIEKRILKQHTSSQKGDTLVDEPLARVFVGKHPFDVLLQQTETVHQLKTPEPTGMHMLVSHRVEFAIAFPDHYSFKLVEGASPVSLMKLTNL
jgi:hypothetical protein